MSLAENVRILRERAGMTQAELAEKLGKGQTTIFKIENGQTLRPRFMDELAQALGVTRIQLEFGTPETVGSDSPAYSLKLSASHWDTKKMDSEPDAAPIIPAQRHVAALDEQHPPATTHIRIMRYDAIASAGGCNADWVIRENDDDPLYFRRNWFKARHLDPDNLRAMYVRGDSMEPYLYNHDTIIVDTSDTEIMDGDVYTIMYRKRHYVKELRNHVDGISIISRNEKYAPMLVNFEDIKNEQDFCVLGKVVWRGG